MPSVKEELGKTLVELGREFGDVVVISGDLGKSTGASAFEVFPERYFNLGISEQDMIGTAAGLSVSRKDTDCQYIRNIPSGTSLGTNQKLGRA